MLYRSAKLKYVEALQLRILGMYNTICTANPSPLAYILCD